MFSEQYQTATYGSYEAIKNELAVLTALESQRVDIPIVFDFQKTPDFRGPRPMYNGPHDFQLSVEALGYTVVGFRSVREAEEYVLRIWPVREEGYDKGKVRREAVSLR